MVKQQPIRMSFKKILIKFIEWFNNCTRKKVEKCDDEIAELKRKLENKSLEIEILIREKNELKQGYNNCILALFDKDKEIQKPDWLVGHMNYRPKRRFVSKTKDLHLYFVKPQYCFDKSTILYDLLKENNLLNVSKTYENMKKIMQLITSQITYEEDLTDNWRPISDVLMFKLGDCDDSGGIAITSAIGMAGWREDETFCWLGWYYPKGKSVDHNNKICHAWNITKCEGQWYVLEGTNNRAVPRLWKDWKDKYEGSIGGCNWKFEGVIKDNKTYL